MKRSKRKSRGYLIFAIEENNDEEMKLALKRETFKVKRSKRKSDSKSRRGRRTITKERDELEVKLKRDGGREQWFQRERMKRDGGRTRAMFPCWCRG